MGRSPGRWSSKVMDVQISIVQVFCDAGRSGFQTCSVPWNILSGSSLRDGHGICTFPQLYFNGEDSDVDLPFCVKISLLSNPIYDACSIYVSKALLDIENKNRWKMNILQSDYGSVHSHPNPTKKTKKKKKRKKSTVHSSIPVSFFIIGWKNSNQFLGASYCSNGSMIL